MPFYCSHEQNKYFTNTIFGNFLPEHQTKQDPDVNLLFHVLTSLRDETIWSLLRALASLGGVKMAKREIVVDAGSDTELGPS